MSLKAKAGVAAVVVLGCAAGAYYWLQARPVPSFPEVASAEPPGFHAAPTADKPAKSPAQKPKQARDAKKPAPSEDPAPALRAGEVLEYTANLSKLNNVANLKLQVTDRGNYFGKSSWHLQAFAHTLKPMRIVYELDDQFDSYSDAATLASLQYEMHLSERGEKVESRQRMTTTGKEPAPAGVTQTRVLPGTRDPLGMMEYLRNVDWAKTPEVRGPVYEGHKLYEVRAKFEGPAGNVSVPAGSYAASMIQIKVFDNGTEMKDAFFTLYLAKNQGRTPVLLEATLPFADARVELLNAK